LGQNVSTFNRFRELGRFVASYGFWILILASTNVVVWLAMEFAWRTWPPSDVWAVRMYLLSGLLLLDNLGLLWWYADSTKQLVHKAEAQRALLADQVAQGYAEYTESQRRLLIAQKPAVYIERVEDPDRQGHVNYSVRNAGGGPAVNVYYVGLFDLEFGEPRSLGAVAASDVRALPYLINKQLQEGHGGIAYVLIAEGHYTRTTQWSPTLNLRTPTAGRHGGQVLFRSARPTVAPPRFEFQSLRDYLANNGDGFAEQLLTFSKEEAE
jgi:hypothetical protein